jgi:hypothetical protein
MFRFTCGLVLLAVAALACVPGIAHALGVRLSIRGAGAVQKASILNPVGAECGLRGLQSPTTTPTGILGDQCVPGSPTVWEADNQEPDTALTGGPSGLVPSSSASFTFTSSEPGDFLCSLDSGAQETCESGIAFSGLAEGPHSFQVWARNASGVLDPTPAERVWTVDTVAPETTIVSGPPHGSSTTSSSAAFTFSSSESGDFVCRLDFGAEQPCESEISYTGLAEGTHSFEVWARDAAGNVDSTPDERSWTIDTGPPDTSILTGPPSGPVASSSATFTFRSSEPGDFVCSLDGGVEEPCVSGVSYAGLSEGPHGLRVWARDGSGVLDPTPAEWAWTVDTLAPDTSILTGPAGLTTRTTATITFASSEAGSSFLCRLDSRSAVPCSSPFTAGGLEVGPHTLRVWAIDAAGNDDVTPAELRWTVTAPPPQPPGPEPPTAPQPPAPQPPAPQPSAPQPPAAPAGPGRSLAPVRSIALAPGGLRLSKGTVRLKVSCPPGPACSGSVTIATAGPVGASKQRGVRLGKTTYRLAGGKRATLRVKLSAKGLRLLRKAAKARVKITAVTVGASGRKANASWTRTLRR